ncbi:MAG: hypothetical protein WD771_06895 [Gemmatimonadaceae bacterium]
MLFSTPSVLTMIHGIVLSGGALLALAAALFAVRAMALPDGAPVSQAQGTSFARVTSLAAILLWFAVLGGTYLVFPLYRAAPPEGLTALAAFPRALLMSDPETRWLHAFAMEIKEHMPWIAAMLATAVAVVAHRRRATLLADGPMRRVASALLATTFVIVSFVAILGVFVNKVAPLE